MDENKITFESLFRWDAFIQYSSPECEKAYKKFDSFLQNRFNDCKTRNDVESELNRCCTVIHESGFFQGFCFAVKIMNFLNEIE